MPTAIGVRREDGKRMILGVSAELSEAEPHWRGFLVSLKERGIGIPDSLDLRCSRRPASRTQGRLQCESLAALPIPPAAECTGLCAKSRYVRIGRRRYPHGLQYRLICTRRRTLTNPRRKLRKERTATERMDGNSTSRRAHRLQFART